MRFQIFGQNIPVCTDPDCLPYGRFRPAIYTDLVVIDFCKCDVLIQNIAVSVAVQHLRPQFQPGRITRQEFICQADPSRMGLPDQTDSASEKSALQAVARHLVAAEGRP